jgi:beta-lactamase regulating signal transducer with metallopeptidase domain
MIAWLLANMAWTSAAMLLVLAIRGPFARLFGAGPVYALWLVPALRLVMPPLPPFASVLPSPIPAETLVIWAGDGAAPSPALAGADPWLLAVAAVWALGAAALLAWQWLAYRRFLGEIARSSRTLGAHRGLALVESGAVQGPVALGLIWRRIVVPADFASRYSAGERLLALDHEAVHHRRGDIWWNHLGLLILALNWFNPVAWFAFRAFRADQELACDAAVAAAASAESRHDYARALIKSASRPGLIAACPLNHADQLKRRLTMMKHHKISRARMLGGGAAILVLGGLSLALGSAGLAQSEPPKQDPAQQREEQRAQHRHVVVRTVEDDAADPELRRHPEHERVIVMTTRHGDGHHGEGEHHAMMMHGDHGEIVIPRCEGGQVDEVDEGADHDRTRIVLCAQGDVAPAQRAERLARVRERIANDDELSAEQKARVTAALDRQIARLRGQ